MNAFNLIRKKLHPHLKRMPVKDIFKNGSIKNDGDDQYAFHYGGRKELQYNIGFLVENGKQLFRYGVALSLKENQSLPDFTELEKQFIRLNDYIQLNQSKLNEYRLIYHDEKHNYYFPPIGVIDNDKFSEGYFIFFGKIIPENQIDFDEILTTFDQLLDCYKFVEGGGELNEIDTSTDGKFEFVPGNSLRVKSALRRTNATKREVSLRHNQIQGRMYNILIEKYGRDKVRTEHDTKIGTSIDLVVKDTSGLIFYEIKTHSDIRYCIRNALGQLLEYAYWPKPRNPTKLVIISENKITDKAKKYLQIIRAIMGLNIYYQQFDFDNNTLSEPY